MTGKKTYIFALICFVSVITKAQLNPRFSQFIINEFQIHPAAAGVDGQTVVNFTGRKEWLGFGRNILPPESYSFYAQVRILKRKPTVKEDILGKYVDKSDGKVGLGIYLVNDANGIFKQNGVGLSYAYHIQLPRYQLSFGITASMHQLGVRTDNLSFKDQGHELLPYAKRNISWIPDLGGGIFIKSRKLRIGFSVAQLMQSQLFYFSNNMNNGLASISYKRYYYLSTAYRNDLFSSTIWNYETSFLLRMYDFLKIEPKVLIPKIEADFMLRLIYDNKFWCGAAIRTTSEYVLLTGLKFNNYSVSYSFDYGNNGISRYSNGSHEISITARFRDNLRRYKWYERF